MKIVIVNKHRDDALGGSELQCDFIASELVERGCEVFYIAPDGNQKNYNREYKVIPCKEDGSEILNHILKVKPDVVYWRFNKNYFHASVKELKANNIPIIFAASHIKDLKPWVFNDGRNFRDKIKNIFKHRLEHNGFKYVDAVTVNNEEFLSKISFDKKIFVQNGMIEDSVPFSWENPYCVWVANIKYRKRPELFVKAAEEFEDKGLDFLMIGDIHQYSYNWIAEKKKTSSNFYYLGPKSIKEVNGILKRSEFHVHTCTPEGFPNIFIQAWLQKKASITYSYDPSNLIQDKKFGFCSENKWHTFTEHIELLFNDKKKREDFGENAYNYASDTFKIEKSVDALKKLIEDIRLSYS